MNQLRVSSMVLALARTKLGSASGEGRQALFVEEFEATTRGHYEYAASRVKEMTGSTTRTHTHNNTQTHRSRPRGQETRH